MSVATFRSATRLCSSLRSAYCSGCIECRYRVAGCPIMEPRLSAEKKSLGREH
jgi:hypothetical protein